MRTAVVPAALAIALVLAAPASAVIGVPDLVPAATLLVPFFETGVDAAVNEQDTLLAVTNLWFEPQVIHYTFWTMDGKNTTVRGNVTLQPSATWTAASRDLIRAGTDFARSQLLDAEHPQFYRGFVTIDAVTRETEYSPTGSFYPFDGSNWLIGFVYYARLSQGAANGMAMVPIEHTWTVSPDVDVPLRGFYRSDSRREQISVDAQACATQHVYSGKCTTGDFVNHATDIVALRTFGGSGVNGSSRAVLFTWTPGRIGGPSKLCETAAYGCKTTYRAKRYDESGQVFSDSWIALPHVVNVIDLAPGPSGWLYLQIVPSVLQRTQTLGLTFNSGTHPSNPAIKFDVVLQGFSLF